VAEPSRINCLAGVDQHQLAVVLGFDRDLGLSSDGDTVARLRLNPIHPHAAAWHQVQVAARVSVDGDRLTRVHGRAENLRIGVDGQRAVMRIAACEQLEGPVARLLRERHRAPTRRCRRLVGFDPDLEERPQGCTRRA